MSFQIDHCIYRQYCLLMQVVLLHYPPDHLLYFEESVALMFMNGGRDMIIHRKSFFFSSKSLCLSPNYIARFLWREKASIAISRHYKRFDVYEEAEANKAAGKYENVSIDHQIEFYRREGLTPYSLDKLPITSGRCMIHAFMFA